MAYKIGQRVVCIGAFYGGYGDEADPMVGTVYTIRGIETNRPHAYPDGLWLEEIYNKPRLYLGYALPQEASFSADKFRPLIERKTDISIFTAMLKPIQVPA